MALKGQARNAEMIVFGIILLLERSHFSDVGDERQLLAMYTL